VSLESQLVVGAILFCVGIIGFLTRRNLILMILSAELMLHGVSVNLTAFGRFHGNASGQVFTIFVLTIAACEAGLSLALILALYQRRKSLDVFLWNKLAEQDIGQPEDPSSPTSPPALPADDLPRLIPTGRIPKVPTAVP
jgi:NADH-quinone oxidoreductase subunit K